MSTCRCRTRDPGCLVGALSREQSYAVYLSDFRVLIIIRCSRRATPAYVPRNTGLNLNLDSPGRGLRNCEDTRDADSLGSGVLLTIISVLLLLLRWIANCSTLSLLRTRRHALADLAWRERCASHAHSQYARAQTCSKLIYARWDKFILRECRGTSDKCTSDISTNTPQIFFCIFNVNDNVKEAAQPATAVAFVKVLYKQICIAKK